MFDTSIMVWNILESGKFKGILISTCSNKIELEAYVRYAIFPSGYLVNLVTLSSSDPERVINDLSEYYMKLNTVCWVVDCYDIPEHLKFDISETEYVY